MPLNFTKIFADSWNFIINNQKMCLLFIFLFALNGFMVESLHKPIVIDESYEIALPPSQFWLLLANFIINITLNVLCIYSINTISNQRFFNFYNNLSRSLGYIIGTLAIYVITCLPLAISLGLLVVSSVNSSGLSIFALFSLFLSMYIFIKLCLSIYIYIIEGTSIKQALNKAWITSKDRFLVLFVYCLIVYCLAQLFGLLFNLLSSNRFFSGISVFINASIWLFVNVFGYRFYHLFMHNS